MNALVAALLAALLAVALPSVAAGPPAGRHAVASESPAASRAALRQMRLGGNAIDAAVTAALVAGVTQASSSGIGGGGFAMIWLGEQKKAVCYDFRETASEDLDAAAFEQRPFPPERRGALIGTPGEVAGLFALHRRFGARPWKDVVAPAVAAARRGFATSRHMAMVLAAFADSIQQDPGLAALYYPGGKPRRVGAWMSRPKLAKTLDRVAKEGPRALYRGTVAESLQGAARAAGGALGLADLASYTVVERLPIHVSWEGRDVYTMSPPSAGGLMVGETLRMFSKRELEKLGFNTGAYRHLLAEAMRGALADRMRYIGDPDHQRMNIGRLLSKGRLARRKRKIGLSRTNSLPQFGLEERGTHHLVTADAAGNMVSLTTTVNYAFGAKVMAPETGVVLNNELDDFSKKSDVEPFGMTESPNRPRPGARPVSSMTPTIVVEDGRAVLGLGGSGGMTIATNVTQVLLSRLVFGHTPQAAVDAPRFAVPTKGATIALEKSAPQSLVEDLERRGETVTRMRFSAHAVQLIAREGDTFVPAADPRKHGLAAAW